MQGQEYYLVKWKGWTEDYDSWVAKEDLNCPALVAQFFRNQDKAASGTPCEPDPAELKAQAEAAELQAYIEDLIKPTNEDVAFAMQLICSGTEKPKNGVKSNAALFGTFTSSKSSTPFLF